MSRQQILENYQRELQQNETELARDQFWSSQLTWIRGCSLLLALVLWGYGWLQLTTLWWLPGLLATLVFFVLAATNEHFDRRARKLRYLTNMTSNSIACMQRDWKAIQNTSIVATKGREAFAQDLDLVGKASLYRLVAWARTPMGRSTLRDWFLTTPIRDEVVQRQHAVRAMLDESEWRREFQLHSELLAASPTGPEALIAWGESEGWLSRKTWLKWLTRILSIGFVVTLVGVLTGLIDKVVGGYTLVVISALNFATTVSFVGSVHMLFNQVSSKQNDVAHYRRLFQLLAQAPRDGQMLEQIHEDATDSGIQCYQQIDRLGRIMAFANMRRNGLLGILYLILQFIVLWDFHVLAWLESWQRHHGRLTRQWFEALGRLEAVNCLSRFSAEEPDWCFPEIVDMEKAKSDQSLMQFCGEELGHPLIHEDQRVCNSATVGPPGTVLLVTGSNMSGKSTLLRSFGVNIALAQAGAKVCATSLVMPVVHVETSMRISDSLNDGVSFFMAELKRLKEVVDLADQTKADPQRCFFYLLDEILQGTNSRERHIAVQEVIRHLIDCQAIGAISTHDLELANADGLGDVCHPIHFRETIETEGNEKKMTFDFKLREGVATTSNALKLLELVGLR